MTIRLNPSDYTAFSVLDEWTLTEWQQECRRLAAFSQQQQHLVDNLTLQLSTKDQQLGRLEEQIREMKRIAGRIVRSGEFRHRAGTTTKERMANLYSGGQDD